LKIKFGKALKFTVCVFLLLAFSSNTIYYQVQAQTELSIKHFTFNVYGIFDTTPQIYAGLYDMSVAGWDAYVSNNLEQVKAIKPDFKSLIYWNMRSVQNVDWMSEVWDACVANGWFLLDSRGNRIYTDVGYLIDFGDSAYQAWIANYLNALMNSVSYDGIYGDQNLAWGVNEYCWGCEAAPINPRTGQVWTDAEVRQALIAYHKAIKNAIGSKLLVCNGIWSGYRFYDHKSAYQEILSASPLDGFMSESLWHPYIGSTPCIWMSEQQWLQAVQFLIWVQDNWLLGHPERCYVPVVKLAFGNQRATPIPTGSTRQQMAIYGYASTLLGIKQSVGNQVYFSSFADTAFIEQYLKPMFDAEIGTPAGDLYMIGGTHVYARDFSNGKVLVNPTDSSYTVNLGSPNFVNAATGQSVPQTITIPPHTGRVLTGATEPSPSPSPTPSTEIWTDKAAYDNGETMYVYVQATNPGPAINIRLTAKIGLPGGGTYGLWTIYQGYVPAGYYGRAILWETFQVPHSTAAGTYSWICEMRDAATNAQIDSDTYYWTAT